MAPSGKEAAIVTKNAELKARKGNLPTFAPLALGLQASNAVVNLHVDTGIPNSDLHVDIPGALTTDLLSSLFPF